MEDIKFKPHHTTPNLQCDYHFIHTHKVYSICAHLYKSLWVAARQKLLLSGFYVWSSASMGDAGIITVPFVRVTALGAITATGCAKTLCIHNHCRCCRGSPSFHDNIRGTDRWIEAKWKLGRWTRRSRVGHMRRQCCRRCWDRIHIIRREKYWRRWWFSGNRWRVGLIWSLDIVQTSSLIVNNGIYLGHFPLCNNRLGIIWTCLLAHESRWRSRRITTVCI